MSDNIERVLDECLARLKAGESIESCLMRYSERAGELRPLLETARMVLLVPAPRPRAVPAVDGKQRMLAAVHERGKPAEKIRPENQPRPVSKALFSRYANYIWFRMTGKEILNMKLVRRFALALVVVALLAGGAGAGAVSAQAQPGDALYPLKTALQDARLLMTTDQAARRELDQRIQAERLAEVREAMQAGRSAVVHFGGLLSAFDDGQWTVGDLTVYLDAETEIRGTPEIGAVVRVIGLIQADATILARRLIVHPAAQAIPAGVLTRTAMPTSTGMPEGLPTARPTRTPLPTLPAVGTPLPVRTALSTLRPDRTPVRTPAWTPPAGRTPRITPQLTPRITPNPTKIATRLPTGIPTDWPTAWPTYLPTYLPTLRPRP